MDLLSPCSCTQLQNLRRTRDLLLPRLLSGQVELRTRYFHDSWHFHVIVKAVKIMKSPAEIERLLMERLKLLLSSVPGFGQPKVEPARQARDEGFGVIARVLLPTGKEAVLYVECKSEPRPSLFAARALKEVPKGVAAVLAAPVVSQRMAELCQQRGWSWYDLAATVGICVSPVMACSFSDLHAAKPPSIVRLAPVTKAASGLAR